MTRCWPACVLFSGSLAVGHEEPQVATMCGEAARDGSQNRRVQSPESDKGDSSDNIFRSSRISHGRTEKICPWTF